ncbi:hypothetical protein BDZ94DRAFT_791699 [Collybia nuda]|uniref:Integrase core domain-containing protein n=1 Tax=Collybia nuda TaxID=64659 RepID=A0A9P6CH32_9AGAR|nr:hypothetical protein BDZ94DRAFT_791699 [Collybia nuda]
MSSSNNPSGKNQHKDCPPPNDQRVEEILREYHRKGITARKQISKMLMKEGIKMSEATVTRRRKDLGLLGSGTATRITPEIVRRQLVVDQMSKDPSSSAGPRTVRERIAFDTGILLTRDYITDEMRIQDPEGFRKREPEGKKVHRTQLISLGIHHEWSADGHDKLSQIGFPIWGVRDKYSGKWLGLWVVPNNRLKDAIGYLYLSLVKELGGMPLQSTTDCGSETVLMYALANALREFFSPDLDLDELAAHKFLKSIYNITIERGWYRLRISWGDNVKIFWAAGSEVYNSTNTCHFNLVQWLWPKLIQQELDEFRERANAHTTRFDREKQIPSGVSPDVAFALFEDYGGEDCLQPVDINVVQSLMEEIGGEDLIRFVSVEYADRAQNVYDTLGIQKLSFQNVWDVFSAMLPYFLE